jgi:chromate reductase, NAD(P)H dehydrogenase (quinone)
MKAIKIAAISGSIKQNSANSQILRFIQAEFPQYNLEIFSAIDQFPFYNPDIDKEDPPPAVVSFRDALRSSNALIICTPEYAFNIPGLLKNALDWIVSTGELYQKPVITITASPLPSGGDKAQVSLRSTLTALGADIYDEGKLLIGQLRNKMNIEGEITDPTLKTELRELMKVLPTRIEK